MGKLKKMIIYSLTSILIIIMMISGNKEIVKAYVNQNYSDDPYGTVYVENGYEYTYGLNFILDNDPATYRFSNSTNPATLIGTENLRDPLTSLHNDDRRGWGFDHAEWYSVQGEKKYSGYYQNQGKSYNEYVQDGWLDFQQVPYITGNTSYPGVQDGGSKIYTDDGTTWNRYRRAVLMVYKRKLPSPQSISRYVNVDSVPSGKNAYVSGSTLWIPGSTTVSLGNKSLDTYDSSYGNAQWEGRVKYNETDIQSTDGSININRYINGQDSSVGSFRNEVGSQYVANPTLVGTGTYGNSQTYLDSKLALTPPNNDLDLNIQFSEMDKYGIWASSQTGFSYGSSSLQDIKTDNEAPIYSSYEIKNKSEAGYDVYIYGVSDSRSGVNRVVFPTWTERNGQDDIIWGQGENLGNGAWHYRVNTSDHNNETGWYYTNIYLYDNVGNGVGVGIPRISVDTTPPIITANPAKVSWVNRDITVTLTAKDVGTGVKDIYYAWSQSNTVAPTDFTKIAVNGAPETAITTTTQTQEGQWYLWYYADDNAEPINVTPKAYSGLYQIDKTPPVPTVDPTSTYWTNKDVTVTITAKDDLSGVKDIYYAWSKSNTIAPAAYTKVPGNGGAVETTNATQTAEGIWYLWYYADDNANTANTSNRVASGTYLIDKTPPTNSFSVSPGVFQGNGVKIQSSTHGAGNAMYGTLNFQDDLSGVANLSYSWTFESSDSEAAYTTIYTSPQTYTDRSQERINKDIEKPVGDNLYLHVKEYDQAGNYTYTTYGPFEDPIALSDFEITNITDPEWEKVFWKDSALTQPTGKTFKVKELPIDSTSNTVYSNAKIKKGYAFNFDITSNYLYRDNDRIEIKPFFYYFDGTNRIPVDCYYNLNNNPFTLVGSDKDTLRLNLDTNKYGSVWIGGLSKLTLTKGVRIVNGDEFSNWQNKIQYTDGKIQWWYGRYYIPSNANFVKHGDTPTPDKVLSGNNIIVNFQIIGYKNGIETLSQDQMYNYVDNNWVAEGGPKNNNYQAGDVMVYDNSKNALDDFTAHIIQ